MPKSQTAESGNTAKAQRLGQAREQGVPLRQWGPYPSERQRLYFAVALWNGKDPIIKERLFGLTNSEANHGEDVKEYYYYLDSTPTHSYMKYLYKYPQAAF